MNNTTHNAGLSSYDEVSIVFCGFSFFVILYFCLFRKEKELENDLNIVYTVEEFKQKKMWV